MDTGTIGLVMAMRMRQNRLGWPVAGFLGGVRMVVFLTIAKIFVFFGNWRQQMAVGIVAMNRDDRAGAYLRRHHHQQADQQG